MDQLVRTEILGLARAYQAEERKAVSLLEPGTHSHHLPSKDPLTMQTALMGIWGLCNIDFVVIFLHKL